MSNSMPFALECVKDIENLDKYISNHKPNDRIKKVNRYLLKVIESISDTFPESLFLQWTTK